LQYEKHLEVWKLGETDVTDIDLAARKDGDCLQTVRSPRKYLHLRSKNDLNIVCSSLGSDPANRPSGSNSPRQEHTLWLSYSDLNVIHIYKLEISGGNGKEEVASEPKLRIKKIESLPLACGNRPAVLMKFYSYEESGVGLLRLCYLTNKSCLQCLKLVNFESGFVLESSIQCISQDDILLTDNRVYLFALRDDHAATVDTDQNLIVWSLKSQAQVCSLPSGEHLAATCLSFHPFNKNLLLVAYANRRLVEFDVEASELTSWSRETSDRFPKQWAKQHTKLLGCFYDRLDLNKIIAYDEQYFTVINKGEKMPDSNEKIFQLTSHLKTATTTTMTTAMITDNNKDEANKQDASTALHITNKYKVRLYIGVLGSLRNITQELD
jgi:hypothetical protein